MIIFLYGPDTFRSRRKLLELKDKFRRDVDPTGLNLSVLDGSSLDPVDFERALLTTPFLAPKRMVVVDGLLAGRHGKTGLQPFIDLLQQETRDDVIVVFWEGLITQKAPRRSVKAKTKKAPSASSADLLTLLLKQHYVQEFALLTPIETARWATTEIGKRGGTIEPRVLTVLVDLVGNDLWRLNNEIGKLIALADGRPITQALVHELVADRLEEDVFKLIDAVSVRNKPLAIRLIDEQFRSGAKPTELLATLTWHYKNLLLVKAATTDHDFNGRPEYLAAEFGLHPFVVKKLLASAPRYQLSEVQHVYHELQELEFKLKTSQASPEVLFDLLVVTGSVSGT